MLLTSCLYGGQESADELAQFRAAAQRPGNVARGKQVFDSQAAACTKCHAIAGSKQLAGPDLAVIGDKLTRQQLIEALLSPSARIHPDYATLVVITTEGKSRSGVLRRRTESDIELFDSEGRQLTIPLAQVEDQQRGQTSLMPTGLTKNLTSAEFTDLVEYLTTLRQDRISHPGLANEIQAIDRPIKLVALHREDLRFDHPVWIIAKPGADDSYLVVEQQSRKVWQLTKGPQGDRKELFVDLSDESIAGEFEGVMCLAFHPNFLTNRRYFVNYHVRENGVFSPVIAERSAANDFCRDSGEPSRRLLKIEQPTDLHWGGMLAFGPDGYLYIGAGDGGPQQDPDGHGQDLRLLLGKILRIDVDATDGRAPYAIPASNPFRGRPGVLPEIWAYGFRMPWRFSWDPETNDLWVGEIGQNLFEEVSIVRAGENHGWNVFEGFTEFSDRYRRRHEKFTPPVLSYRRKDGVSVTGGYVYRGQRSASYFGAYIFSDFESKKIWAATQSERRLLKIRQIGNCPERPASFGIDHDGELFIVGYEGTIFRLMLDDSVFE